MGNLSEFKLCITPTYPSVNVFYHKLIYHKQRDGTLIIRVRGNELKLREVVKICSESHFHSFMSTSEEVAVVDGDDVIAPSLSTRAVTPLDPPTSAEEEENGRRVTSTSASDNNIHDATTTTTRRRDSNFSRSTDPTTNVSQRRHREHHRHNRQPPQSQQPRQAVISVRVRCYISCHFVENKSSKILLLCLVMNIIRILSQ